MKSKLKTSTVARHFPILAVENDYLVGKDGSYTVAYCVELPTIYTLSSADYEMLHGLWVKALKVLPPFSVVHKQDWFTRQNYHARTDDPEASFLARSFERHFNERPYLHHTCYLFVTQSDRNRSRQSSLFNALCREFLLPQSADPATIGRFVDAVEQMESILGESGLLRLHRLGTEEILGERDKPGILDRYLSLSDPESPPVLSDIRLEPQEMVVGDKILSVHSLSDLDDLPQTVPTDSRYERLSTDRSDTRLSFAAPVGLLLFCDHLYNQYVFIDHHEETLKTLERTARNMNSLARYSRENGINKEWIDLYLDTAHSESRLSVRAHANVMAWSTEREKLAEIRNEVGSQLAAMGCTPRHNTVDVPMLF